MDPAIPGGVVGDRGGGQEQAQEVFDLAQAQAHREGGGHQFLLLVLVEEDARSGRRFGGGGGLGRLSIRRRVGVGRGGAVLLELASVLVDDLPAAPGLLSLAGDGAVAAGEDGGGFEDSGANG